MTVRLLIMFTLFSLGFELGSSKETEFPKVNHPKGNEPNEARLALGERLFFDPIMSEDGKVSCSSCHAPHLAFSDSVALSRGFEGRQGTQNAPSLANVAFHPYFTRAGGVPTLEMQILVPIQEHNEFNTNILSIAERMKQDSSYVAQSAKAYGRAPDPFVITRALACFERTLISDTSPYDRYLDGDDQAMTERQVSGMELFFSERTDCSSCHSGILFSDFSFQNNGLYEQYIDSGRFRFSGLPSDRDLFKVPSLRNLSYTAPYMHDGSISSLAEVIEHYSDGMSDHPRRSEHVRPLHLTQEEKDLLLDFLTALDDARFVSRFSKNTRDEIY